MNCGSTSRAFFAWSTGQEHNEWRKSKPLCNQQTNKQTTLLEDDKAYTKHVALGKNTKLKQIITYKYK